MPLRRPRSVLLLCGALLLLAAAGPPAEPVSREAGELARYLAFDSSNPPGNERAAVDWLAALARGAGATTEVLISPAGRASLVARLPATVANPPVLVLLHHVDVVPAGDGWRRAPFSGDLHEGAIWGRGAIDAKSYGIAHLAALAAAAKLPDRRRELVLLAVADEEAGGGEGVGWLLDAHPEILDRVEAVLNEGGANKSVGERVLYWGIEVDQKRPLWLEMTARGRGGHAATASPENAAHLLVAALARRLAAPPPLSGSAAAVGHFERLGRIEPRAARALAPAKKLLAGETLTDGERRALAGYEGLLGDTLQVTTLHGSDRINMIPAEATARLDVRLLPETDSARFLAALEKDLGDDLEVAVLLSTPAATASSTDTAIYRGLEEVLATRASPGPRAPVVPIFIPAFTDSRLFRARGIPAYGFCPFALDARELLTVHAADERISLVAFDQGVETMRRVVRSLLSGSPTR